MDKRIFLPVLIVLLSPLFLISQNDAKLKRAKERFEKRAYANAISSYEELIENGYTSDEALKSLGDAYYYNADYASASEWYGKLVEENQQVEPEYLYRYAQTLKSIGNYQDSDKWMKKLQSFKNTDGRVQKFINKTDYLEEINRNSGRYEIQNVSFNSEASDFAPSFYGETLVFSSARDTGRVVERIHAWNNKAFLNLYQTNKTETELFSNPKRLSAVLNKKTHESSAVFTKDGNTIYFTRNNSKDGKFERDEQGVSRLKLYRAKRIDGEWKNIEELPFNSDEYSVAHPALSPDEKLLYFASDMPGTYGHSDIFISTINDDGSLGAPKNLGPMINSESRETFPFISDDYILYFASDGHPGLGGLDIFATKIENTTDEVINLGEPVNSRQDDFSYVINGLGKGYFASNRGGGKGSDDIYSFTENTPLEFECISNITGIVKDRETDSPLPNAKVMAMSGEDVIGETVADTSGAFNLDIDCNNENYSLMANKEGYLSHSESLVIEKGKPTEVVLALPRAKSPTAIPGTDLIKHLKLNPIYFDLDKSNIRPDAQQTLDKVLAYLKEYPDVKISIESHTDAKASKSYNQRLSERRATSTFDYLVSKGINTARMKSKGFGEKNLINSCRVWAECSAEENEKNRRSEIIVIK